jgi:hypothetical protein
MNIVKYQYKPGNIVPVQEMKYTPQINELERTNTKYMIECILKEYLELTGKENGLSDIAISLLSSKIIDNFGFLELQEIELIISNGVCGKYGPIYGAITLDIFFGWLQSYKENERILRPDPKQNFTYTETGNEISQDEFYKRNPELLINREKREILTKHKRGTITINNIKRLYEIATGSDKLFLEDMETIKSNYEKFELKEEISESMYILEMFRKNIKTK